MFFDDPIPLLWRAPALLLLAVAGAQDWRTHEAADWTTWPIFLCGSALAVWRATLGDLTPLLMGIFVLLAWRWGWMGGADARILAGLWGVWPIAGLAGMILTGAVGFALVLRGRGQARIPALAVIALAAALTLLIEFATIKLLR